MPRYGDGFECSSICNYKWPRRRFGAHHVLLARHPHRRAALISVQVAACAARCTGQHVVVWRYNLAYSGLSPQCDVCLWFQFSDRLVPQAWSKLPDSVAASRALQFIGDQTSPMQCYPAKFLIRFYLGFGLKCGARNCDGLTAGDIAAARHKPELLTVLNLHHSRQIQVTSSRDPSNAAVICSNRRPVLQDRVHRTVRVWGFREVQKRLRRRKRVF